ncbi:MAG TPA: hypothetical protein VJX92_21270 [Methylomirabilota bacterium]|nr:hypothetical protein [Methylomirabilota bacterium]
MPRPGRGGGGGPVDLKMRLFRLLIAALLWLVLFGVDGIISAPAQSIPSSPGWHVLPKTAMQPVCPPNGFGGSGYDFFDSCRAVVTAWNSAVMDTRRNRLVLWGGGHSDYFGNEVYALDLKALTVQRLTDPALPLDMTGCPESLANGTQPNSRHTYDGITYIAHADRLFAFGGARATCGYASDGTWTFDFKRSVWESRKPGGSLPRPDYGVVAVYDAVSRKVFVHDSSTLYAYTLETDRYESWSSGGQVDYHLAGVIDPVRRKFVMVGTGNVYVYDIGKKSFWSGRESLRTRGGEAIVQSGYPGLAYDPVSGRIVAWNGGDSVYQLDLDRGVWTPITYPNGPGESQQNGTFKRWSYSPGSDVFVLINEMAGNAYVLRLAPADRGR